MATPNPIFTIGHSNHALADFLNLLERQAIAAVADVRSLPVSRRNPHFNREELQPQLRNHGLVYVFLGEQLGGRPGQPSVYDADGRVDYQRVRATDFFQRGLDRLQRACEKFTLALMCSEEDPLSCHRGLMIAPALVERGMAPAHLRGDGAVETMAQMEARLLAETKIGLGILDGLFAETLTEEDRRAMLTEAYRTMARKKAFRLRPGETASSLRDITEEYEPG